MTQVVDAEPVDESGLEIKQSAALEALTRGEVDIQVATARRYPRSLKRFKEKALEMACLDEETAEACSYALPRDGKTIEGPSARFAEICASAYGHMRAESRPIAEDDRFITSQGRAWDIENNVAISFEVRRRITDRKGKKYSDDMVTVTANAAGSIALRNAILKVIPKAYWQPVYDQAKKVALGDEKTLAQRRQRALEQFVKMGATPARIFAALDVGGIEDVTLEHLAKLTGIRTAIQEGDTSIDRAFPEPENTRDYLEEELGLHSEEMAEKLRKALEAAKLSKGQAVALVRQHKNRPEDLLRHLETKAAGEKKPADSKNGPENGSPGNAARDAREMSSQVDGAVDGAPAQSSRSEASSSPTASASPTPAEVATAVLMQGSRSAAAREPEPKPAAKKTRFSI